MRSCERSGVVPYIQAASSAASHKSSASTAAALASSLATKASFGAGGAAASLTPDDVELGSTHHNRRRRRRNACWNVTMTCTAMASIVSALVAMYFVQTWITYVAFSIPLFTSSLLLIQQCRLRGVSPLWLLRQTIHKVQQEVHRLQNANQVFRQEVARLETQHRELQHMEQRLEQSVKRKGGDMREMKRLIHEYGTIQRKMKRLIAAEELQQLMSVMLNSDSNKDFIYSE
ncbi:hypothetical protein ACA910_003791 [Epithemia clementina (nom. ined.)]